MAVYLAHLTAARLTPYGRLSQIHFVAAVLAPFATHAPFVKHPVHFRRLSTKSEKLLGDSGDDFNVLCTQRCSKAVEPKTRCILS
jgi:hypothetical protein